MRFIPFMLFFLGIPFISSAQKNGELVGTKSEKPVDFGKETPKELRHFLSPLKYIPAGSFVMGASDSDMDNHYLTRSRTVSIAPFYISSFEVSNMDYQLFCKEMEALHGKDSSNWYLPDTTVWRKSGVFGEAFVDYYFRHPAYQNHPVVGINYRQAYLYCAWLSKKVNSILEHYPAIRKRTGELVFRLPTEAEWEYAAHGNSQTLFTWGNQVLEMGKEKIFSFSANAGSIIDTARFTIFNMDADGFQETNPINGFKPNGYGLYNMCGNVAELTSTIYEKSIYEFSHDLNPEAYHPKWSEYDSLYWITKGGSFYESPLMMIIAYRNKMKGNSPNLFTGFRICFSSDHQSTTH